VGCADSDNPVALADLDPVIEVEIEGARIETFEEVEVLVHIMEGGMPMMMSEVEFELSPAHGEESVMVTAEAAGEGYAAHVTFFEPGEYHLRVMGTPEGHRLSREMGEMEIEVHRRHMLVGTYWVELDVSPAPVLPNTEGHVHILVYDLANGAAGEPVSGLDVELEIHNPDGIEGHVPITEQEAGEYEAEYHFVSPGLYELHLAITADGQTVEGEFHLPVINPESEAAPEQGEGGGHDGH
jgi:hypothetical protein